MFQGHEGTVAEEFSNGNELSNGCIYYKKERTVKVMKSRKDGIPYADR